MLGTFFRLTRRIILSKIQRIALFIARVSSTAHILVVVLVCSHLSTSCSLGTAEPLRSFDPLIYKRCSANEFGKWLLEISNSLEGSIETFLLTTLSAPSFSDQWETE